MVKNVDYESYGKLMRKRNTTPNNVSYLVDNKKLCVDM